MPTKKSRPRPRSATKATTSARRRSTVGMSADEKVKAAEREAGRSALVDGSVPQGEPAAVSAKDAPGELAPAAAAKPGESVKLERAVVGGHEHAETGSGAPHPTAEKAARGGDAGQRFQSIVGPPESANPTLAMDNAQRAAVKDDSDAVFDNLPAGTILESLGPVHGWRATGPGMHRPTGTGRRPIDAIKNLGVPIIRDEELPPDQQSAARRAQEAKEAFAREQAGPAAGAR